MKKILLFICCISSLSAHQQKTGDMLNQALQELQELVRSGYNLKPDIKEVAERYQNMAQMLIKNITPRHRGPQAHKLTHLPEAINNTLLQALDKLYAITADQKPICLHRETIDLLNDLPQEVHYQVAQLRGGSSVGVFIGILYFPVVIITSLLDMGIGQPLSMIPLIGPLLALPFTTLDKLAQWFFAFLTL